MALIPAAYKALTQYIERVNPRKPHKETIFSAVVLTDLQRTKISSALSEFWGRPFPCPLVLDIFPRHGYESRVLKDGFPPSQYLEWLVIGCSDTADVSVDPCGRPHLVVKDVTEPTGRPTYDVHVPVRSNADNRVFIDDVIPKGLPKVKK